jgi:hypothetical protein
MQIALGVRPFRKTQMKTVLLMLILLTTAGPALAGGPQISCETVRAFVTHVGLKQARAQARAAGMTAKQEREARQCFVTKEIARR